MKLHALEVRGTVYWLLHLLGLVIYQLETPGPSIQASVDELPCHWLVGELNREGGRERNLLLIRCVFIYVLF